MNVKIITIMICPQNQLGSVFPCNLPEKTMTRVFRNRLAIAVGQHFEL
jgi:hypothetical protein